MLDMTATGPVRLAEVRSTPLSVDEVLASVKDSGYGGTALFIGSVRDHDQDRDVLRLEYSAHPNARADLERVMSEVAAASPGVALGAIHRIGALEVGDLAVVVAAAAAHRAEAFAAARQLIDRVKSDVSIWKRQEFNDGTYEWVNACD